MILLDIVIFTIIFLSSFLLKPFKIISLSQTIGTNSLKNFKVMSVQKVSDHWKQKFLMINAQRMFIKSLFLGLMIGLFILTILIPLWIFDKLIFKKINIFDYLLTMRGIIDTILPFFVFYFLMKFIKK